MEVSGAEEGFVREWAPCTHILNLIPTRIQNGLFSSELYLTCVDAVSEYIALGTNVGLVYWYDRKKVSIQRLRCEASTSPITFVKIVSTVDYMVAAGNAAGQVTVFQIPKEHPENIPENLKPKVEPKVERYTIGDLHKSPITAIEWSKNGMRLFSGDKNGVIIMTEIDFYMHLCKSSEIVSEQHEIVQLSWQPPCLLVCSVYRSIVCSRQGAAWGVTQLGKKERKSLCALGGVLSHSYSRGAAPAVYCARQGQRVWRAQPNGDVLHTLLFKEAISNPLTIVELLNPRQEAHATCEQQFGRMYMFREQFLVTHNDHILYILDPSSLTAVAVVDHLRRILSLSVHKDEIFVLEGPRSLLRLAHQPETFTHSEEPVNLMSKSLTTSLQQAVNTVRDLTHIDQTVPYIASVLEHPISLLTKLDTATIVNGEECLELPPIKHLPLDISDNVLESIINEFRDVSSDVEEIRRLKTEELQKKLKLYNSIMERSCDPELIHSRRSRRREAGSGGNTPRLLTPSRKPDVSYTSPCVMNISVYESKEQPNDELLEQQIEEKEKILAKMLNLESLSINTPAESEPDNEPALPEVHTTEVVHKSIPIQNLPKQTKVDPKPVDLVPKLVQLPNTWNLENIQLKLDKQNGFKDRSLLSPDEHLDSEWEII